MAINFPSNPSLNDTFTHTDPPNVVVYKWDGTSWIAISGLGSETSVSTLADLTDVSDLAKTNLDILTWFSANSTWAPGESGASSFDGQFSSLTGVPTTIVGYGITDAFDGNYNSLTNKPSLVTSLNNLSDVNTLSITPQTADVLSWTANNTWEPQQASGGGSIVIGSLDDVDASASSSPTHLDILTWWETTNNFGQTTGAWKPIALDNSGFAIITRNTIDNHLNVNTSSGPTNGHVLSWNTTLLGGDGDYEWVAQSGGGGGSTALNDLTDVNTLTNTPQSGDVIRWTANNTWEPQKGLNNIYDYSGGVNILGTAAVSGQVDIDIGGTLKMSAGTCDFTHSLVNFSGATVGGLDNSDVNLSNIIDSAQGVNITGTAAVSGGVDIDIGGTLKMSAGTCDFTHSLVNFSGATVAGLPSTMNTAIAETGVEIEIIVMVITKTSMHRYNGQGSSLGYTFRVNGVDYESPFLDLVPGKTYKFEQGEPSNASHSIRFYEDAAKTIPYTTNVTVSGSAGTSGAYTSIAVTESTPSILHYQCVNHAYMGNQVQVKGIGGGGSYTDTNVDTHLNQSSATSGQVLSWNGTDYAWSNPAGSSTQARENRSLISSSPIPDGGSFDMDFTTTNTTPNAILVPHSYLLQKITTDYSAWVVLYSSSTARTNDSSRLINQDPEPGSGVILEVVTTDTSLQQLITPGVMGFNENITGPDAGTIFFKIVNLSGAQQQITLTLDYLPLEWS